MFCELFVVDDFAIQCRERVDVVDAESKRKWTGTPHAFSTDNDSLVGLWSYFHAAA
jgi:hypothetical protein